MKYSLLTCIFLVTGCISKDVCIQHGEDVLRVCADSGLTAKDCYDAYLRAERNF